MDIKLEFVSTSKLADSKSYYCSVPNENGRKDFYEIEKWNGRVFFNVSFQDTDYTNDWAIEHLIKFGVHSDFSEYITPQDEFEFNLYKDELESFIKNNK